MIRLDRIPAPKPTLLPFVFFAMAPPFFPENFHLPLPWIPEPFQPERTDGDGDAHLFPHWLDPYDLAEAADRNLRPQIGVFQIQKKLEWVCGRKRLVRLEVNSYGAEITGYACPLLLCHIQFALETRGFPFLRKRRFHDANIPAGML